MNRVLRNSLAGLAMASAVAPAAAITINFETPPSAFISQYTESGYQATFLGGDGQGYHGNNNSCSPSCADNGSNYLMTLNSYGGFAHTIRIQALDSSPFTFSAFQGAENPFANNANGNWAGGIRVTGTRADTSTVTQDFALDQVNDGTGGVADFQSFNFSSFFDVFVQLDFTGIPNGNGGRDFSIDALVLNQAQVPAPGSVLLMGLGLLALAWRRKPLAPTPTH